MAISVGGKLLEEGHHLRAAEVDSQHRLICLIDAVQGEDGLGRVDANALNLGHGRLRSWLMTTQVLALDAVGPSTPTEGGTRTFGHLEKALAMHGPWGGLSILLVEQNVRAALRSPITAIFSRWAKWWVKGRPLLVARLAGVVDVFGPEKHNGGHRPRRRSRFLARPGQTIASARGICDSLYCKRAKEGDMPFIASNGLTEAGTGQTIMPPA